MNHKQISIGLVIGLFSVVSYAQQAEQPLSEQQPLNTNIEVNDRGVIQLQETIRASREQPKVLTIVPWQPPADKASLPSPIIKRIEQNFAPISREEFSRKLAYFEQVTTSSDKSY